MTLFQSMHDENMKFVGDKTEQKEITVWTNGKAIRKYTGQDKTDWNCSGKRKGTWYKAKAIIVPIEEEKK